MLFGYTCRTNIAKTPLTETTSCIAGILQHAGDSHLIRTQATRSANGSMTGMLASYESATRGCTDTSSSEKLRKTEPFGCHLIDIRRIQYRVPHE